MDSNKKLLTSVFLNSTSVDLVPRWTLENVAINGFPSNIQSVHSGLELGISNSGCQSLEVNPQNY